MTIALFTLLQNAPVQILAANSARRGYKVENLEASNAITVREMAAPVTATTDGVVTLAFSAVPTAGTFKIKIGHLTTAAIAAGANNATVQTAVRLLAGCGSVVVAAPDAGAGYKLTLTGVATIPVAVSVVDSTLNIPGVSCVQNVGIATALVPSAGTFDLTLPRLIGNVAKNFTAKYIPYNASGADLQAILRRTFNDQALTVTGTGLTGNGFVITFSAKAPQNLLTVSTRSLKTADLAEGQLITFDAEPIAGEFKIKIGELESAVIAWDAADTDIETALQALEGYEDIAVSGDFATGFAVEFPEDLDAPLMEIIESSLVAQDAVDEVQTVSFDNPPDAGSFKLVYDAQETAAIGYDETFAEVQTALRAIPALADVTVSGDFDTGFEVTFPASLGDADLLTEAENTLEFETNPVTINVNEDTTGAAEITVEATVETVQLEGVQEVPVSVTQATPGVAQTDLTITSTVNTAQNAASLSPTVAATATYDRSNDGYKGSVYAATAAASAAIRVTELF